MTAVQAEVPVPRKPLRLWPGVALIIVQCLFVYVLPRIMTEAAALSFIGGMVAALAVILWWLFFSRARWLDRVGLIALIAVSLFLTSLFIHESIAKGARGMLFPIMSVPIVSIAFVLCLAVTRRLSDPSRRAAVAGTVVAASTAWLLLRTGGFTGDFKNDFHWRWTQTPEERLLSQSARQLPWAPTTLPVSAARAPESNPPAAAIRVKAVTEPQPPPAAQKPIVETAAEWSGFRGPRRDSAIPGIRIATDWTASPPVEMWRHAIGPGWSSLAVAGDLVYTQEQRGPDEVVACYRLSNGDPVWAHRDAARFWESNAGAGPRGTPTLGHGRVYTFGATGIVNALNAATGKMIWSQNAATETGTKTPEWGFSSSPLLLKDLVIVAASGQLVAYDAATGARRWTGPEGGASYSSPHLLTKDGVEQILLLSGKGIASVSPADGKPLWSHEWKGYPIVQPNLTSDGDVLISVNMDSGTRRLALTHGTDGWSVKERWTSMGLKPYFNDFVIHKGHVYGFDGAILSCIDLEEGKRKWKGGRYGHGQLILLPDQDLMLVLSESGELVLVKATPDQFTEVAHAKAIEGKTWNHPVLVGNNLIARNGEEMVAFRLATESH